MARNVNVWIDNWRWTGQNVQVPQAAVDITIQWVDADGGQHEHTETVRFPNILQDVPAAWVKDALEDLMLRGLRKRLDVDLEAMAMEAGRATTRGAPTRWVDRVGCWLVENSSLLQWVRRRSDD